MDFRPLWLDGNRKAGIWSRSSVSIMPFERGEQMIVDLDSWEAGYGDGLLGRPSRRMPARDSAVNRSTPRWQFPANHHLSRTAEHHDALAPSQLIELQWGSLHPDCRFPVDCRLSSGSLDQVAARRLARGPHRSGGIQ